ncbi:MAG TPA: VOC family protein, partial [Rariglobus sp.]
AFADPDGIPVEIVAVTNDTRAGWTAAAIPAEHALRGMHTAELTVRAPQATENLITATMGYRLVKRDGNRARFTSATDERSGAYIDVIADVSAAPGAGGSGTIHHIAFSVPDDATELAMQKALHAAGYSVSEVRDRNYFHSIYYREPGGILFEIATANPGFAVDESPASLGTALKLPVQFERARSQIERLLPPLKPTRTSSDQK